MRKTTSPVSSQNIMMFYKKEGMIIDSDEICQCAQYTDMTSSFINR